MLGIAAVALFALSAYAGEFKQDPVLVNPPTDTHCWPGSWSYNYDWATVTTIPVKMRIPFYVHIVNQDAIELFQVPCGNIGKDPAKDKDWPCFQGCNVSATACNFNIKLGVDFAPNGTGLSLFDGRHNRGIALLPPGGIPTPPGTPGTSVNVAKPGKDVYYCVWVWNVDLLGQQVEANELLDVGTLTIKVKPN